MTSECTTTATTRWKKNIVLILILLGHDTTWAAMIATATFEWGLLMRVWVILHWEEEVKMKMKVVTVTAAATTTPPPPPPNVPPPHKTHRTCFIEITPPPRERVVLAEAVTGHS